MDSGPIRARLSAMMFLQYVVVGAWMVPLATYLLAAPDQGGLGFSPAQTSWVYSATALVGLFSSLILGLLADRLFAAQRLLGLLHLAGAIVLAGTGWYCETRQVTVREAADAEAVTAVTFQWLMALMMANALVTMLTLALCNVTGFRNLTEPKRTFGRIRMYGTVGWIIVNMAIDYAGSPISSLPLYVAAGCSVALGLYAFTLPHTPPSGQRRGLADAFGLPALGMFRQSGFRVVMTCALLMSAVQQFFAVYCNPYLLDLGSRRPMALQTMAQTTEVLCLALFPAVLSHLGYKRTLALAIAGWIIRNLIFATGELPVIAIVGLPIHGISFTFFFVVANIYVDRHAPADLRASAQGIYVFIASGLGVLLGNFASAQVLEACRGPERVAWEWFWLAPAAASAVVLIGFLAMFRDEAGPARAVEPALAEAVGV